MKKAFIIIAIILVVLGSAIFFAAFASAGFNYQVLGTSKLETRTVSVGEDFENIRIDENTADIAFAPSEDGTCSVVCRESEKTTRTIAAENGTLSIVSAEQNGWKNLFNLSFENESVTVYLPKDAYETLVIETHTGNVDLPKEFRFNSVSVTGSTGDVRCAASAADLMAIRVDTGEISLDGVSANAIECTVTTGMIRMQSVTCRSYVSIGVSTGRTILENLDCRELRSEGSTGEIRLSGVTAETFLIERSTGDVTLENSDAEEIRIQTSTGDITGTLRTGKTFVTKTTTGDVSVPEGGSGGRCDITTTTGDIRIRIADGQS